MHKLTGAGVINLANGTGSYKKPPVQTQEKTEKQKNNFKSGIYILKNKIYF
jgi:hypothetical protein